MIKLYVWENLIKFEWYFDLKDILKGKKYLKVVILYNKVKLEENKSKAKLRTFHLKLKKKIIFEV